tara:strand:- start:128 stop:259 length:132 start_codon:yes stop_codon:yes gene_type:complete
VVCVLVLQQILGKEKLLDFELLLDDLLLRFLLHLLQNLLVRQS